VFHEGCSDLVKPCAVESSRERLICPYRYFSLEDGVPGTVLPRASANASPNRRSCSSRSSRSIAAPLICRKSVNRHCVPWRSLDAPCPAIFVKTGVWPLDAPCPTIFVKLVCGRYLSTVW